MGGKLTCISQRREDDKKSTDQVKTNQYENIDDNFTILPANNKTKTKTKTKNATNNDVTNTSTSRAENDDGLNYENVTISPKTNQINLTNYEPKISSNSNRGPTNGMTHSFYDSDTTSHDMKTSSSKDNGSHNINTEDIEETMYANYAIASRDNSHSPLNDAQDGVQRSANQKLGLGTGNDVPTAEEVEYAKVLPGKKKEKNKKKSPTPTKPKKAPKLKLKESPPNAQESKTPPSASTTKSPNGLNYTEVEFVSPPVSSAAKRNGNEPRSPAPCPSSTTTYTDVVHKDGLLILIN